ncbi:MAG: preprotein translocase subunit YajC [Candidatus Midichloriaceae bacterium]|jgi:preprotein translocase subunit YajC
MNIALADAANVATSQQSIWTSLAPLAIILVIFYFFVIRPQQKKLKNHNNMVNNMKKGDKVITSGGMMAIISKVEIEDGFVLVEIAENVKVKVKRDTISQVLDNNISK